VFAQLQSTGRRAGYRHIVHITRPASSDVEEVEGQTIDVIVWRRARYALVRATLTLSYCDEAPLRQRTTPRHRRATAAAASQDYESSFDVDGQPEVVLSKIAQAKHKLAECAFGITLTLS
jgi:hypothetical protein